MSCAFRTLIFYSFSWLQWLILSCTVQSTPGHQIHQPTHSYEVLLRCLALCWVRDLESGSGLERTHKWITKVLNWAQWLGSWKLCLWLALWPWANDLTTLYLSLTSQGVLYMVGSVYLEGRLWRLNETVHIKGWAQCQPMLLVLIIDTTVPSWL